MSQYRRGSGPNRTTASTPRAGSPGMGPGHPDRQTLTPLRTSSPSHLDQTQSTTNRRASRPSNVIPSEAMHTGNPEARGPVEDARLLVNFSTGKQDTLPDSAAAALLAPLGEEVAAAHVLSSLSDPQNRLSAPKPLQGGQNRLDETRARRYVAPKSRSASIARGASPSVLHGSRAVSAVLSESSICTSRIAGPQLRSRHNIIKFFADLRCLQKHHQVSHNTCLGLQQVRRP